MKGIKEKLDRIGTLVDSGEGLERDLALDLLREVYAEIKFASPHDAATVAETVTVDGPALEGEDCQAPETEEQAVEDRAEVEEEAPIMPRRVAPDVIRSLYGTGTETEQESEQEQETEPQLRPEPEPLPEPRPKPETRPEPEPNPPVILADVMSAGRRTLGETLKGGGHDTTAHTAAGERGGLKRSIGLNDRFLMIRDMFDGDPAAFDAAIDRLDGFTDLDEAVIWIRDNFDRSADNEGMKLLVALVESKLGR